MTMAPTPKADESTPGVPKTYNSPSHADPAAFLTYDPLLPEEYNSAFIIDELYPGDDIGYVDNLLFQVPIPSPVAGMAKPHTCNFPGCFYRAHSKRDLKRHHTARHSLGPSDKFFCSEPSCKRAQKGWPATRKDLRDRHVRTAHPQAIETEPPSSLTTDEVLNEGAIQPYLPTEMEIGNASFPEPQQDIIVELRRKNARLESQLDEMHRKFEKMRSSVMIAVAAAE